MYRWWVFIHIAGVLLFLTAHGASVAVTFRLRSERDPVRVNALLSLSSAWIIPTYVSLGLLLLGGVVAGFVGRWWGTGWIWTSLVLLLVTIAVMYLMGTRFFRRIGAAAQARMAGRAGEDLEVLLTSGHLVGVAVLGFAVLAVITYLMIFKPF